MSDFPPKLIYRSEDWYLAEMKVDFHKTLLEQEHYKIACANHYIRFYVQSEEHLAFANQIIADAENRIKQLSFELRALELKLKEVEKNDRH